MNGRLRGGNDKELSQRLKKKCCTVKMKDYLIIQLTVFEKRKSVAGPVFVLMTDERVKKRITRRTTATYDESRGRYCSYVSRT